MNNQYIGVVFDGSATLSATQGRDRIPAGPPSGAQSTAGQPDPSLAVDVARELSQQEQNAALTEKKVEMEVGATSINPH